MNKKKRLKKEKNKRIRKERGITLIALVVTIIILIILATISVNMIFSENGLIATAKEAKEHQLNAVEMDQGELNKLSGELTNIINSSGTGESGGSVEVTIEGKTVTLTEKNFGDYLGKVVTNYKPEGETEIVTVNTANNGGESSFTVSTTYRLYYIDFANKYGDGKGTVYLKADCTENKYSLSNGKTANAETIKNLNPELYKEGVTAPTATNNNMKAVTWLLDKSEWNGLKTSGEITGIGNKVNYVVGAPSLEMMMDSYNTHYKLTGETPDYTAIPSAPDTTRKKLFYKYTTGANGYQVGPCKDNSAEYSYYTSINSVKTDAEIDSMYYPGSSKNYWLASPSSNSTPIVLYVNGLSGGQVSICNYSSGRGLCPLVSLKSDVKLVLK